MWQHKGVSSVKGARLKGGGLMGCRATCELLRVRAQIELLIIRSELELELEWRDSNL